MQHILDERFILQEDEDPRDQPANTENADTKPKVLTKESDWEERFKNCKTDQDYQNFWFGFKDTDPRSNGADSTIGYYEFKWKDDAEKVKNWGSGFRAVCKRLGLTNKTNPFIDFLDLLLKEPVNRVGVTTITEFDFILLAEAFEKGILEKTDLSPDGDFEKYNLIFNPNFYTKCTPSDKQTLLEIQQEYKESSSGTGEDIGVNFANLYSKSGNKSNLNAAINPGDQIVPVEELERTLKQRGKRREKATGIVDKIAVNMDENTAKACFIGAYDFFTYTVPAAIDKINKSYKNIPKKVRMESKNPLPSKMVELVAKRLKTATLRYTVDNATSVLKALLQAAKIELEEKQE